MGRSAPDGAGRPTREFRLLRPSISTQFRVSRGKTDNFVDVDTSNSQKIAPSEKREPAAEKEPSPGTASVPVMITKRMEADLHTMGYSQAEIDKMTPAQANDILAGKPVGVPGDGRMVV